MGQIFPQKRNGTVVGYSVYLGVDPHGQKQRRFFRDRPDAEKFLTEFHQDPPSVVELLSRKSELMFCLERVRQVGTTLNDVVSFYLSHGNTKGNIILVEVVDKFIAEKRRVGRSQNYEKGMRYVFGRFLRHFGPDKNLRDLTREQISDYVYVKNRDVSPITKRDILTHLSVLFNFAIRENYVGLNPVTKIVRPTIKFHKPHVLSPGDFKVLLDYCLGHGHHEQLVLFVLTGFCGIRMEEGSRLSWSHIDYDRQTVLVPSEVSKKHGFRINQIPPNGMEWLHRVRDRRRSGRIIPLNWKYLILTAIRKAKIPYHQNCIRHSFCSYGLVSGWSLSEMVSSMGHGGSPSMIYSHDRNVVSEEDGKRWFAIVP
jgi:integrase